MALNKWDYRIKIITCGNTGTGKTLYSATVPKLQSDDPNGINTTEITVGVEFNSYRRRVEEKDFLIQLWDTAGQEKYQSLTKLYYHDIAAVLLFFDVTNSKSFSALPRWMNSIKQNGSNDPVIVVVGNFIDRDNYGHRKITRKQGEQFAKQYGAKYVELSAKTKINLEQPLQLIDQEINQRIKDGIIIPGQNRRGVYDIPLAASATSSSGCCIIM